MTTYAVAPVARLVASVRPEQVRSATYAEFFYGYGASPGVELGRPRQFSQPVPGVFQQRFERGLTIANVGDRPVRVELPTAYSDLEGRVLSAAVVAPRSAEVFRALPSDPQPATTTLLPTSTAARAAAAWGCLC